MVNIPGYNHIYEHRQDQKGGGVSILLKTSIPYKRRKDLDVFHERKTECLFVEIVSKTGKPIVLGSLYRPPNTDITQFNDNIIHITEKARAVA